MPVRIKRVYAEPAAEDGYRVLIDRLWPRGLTKEKARVDLWLRDLGPSTELRRWFGHDPARWSEFAERYQAELMGKETLLTPLLARARSEVVTLLYAARDTAFNDAVVVKELLDRRLGAATEWPIA